MEKQGKPRLAEVLGVEVGELFNIEGETNTYFVDQAGVLRLRDSGSRSISGIFKAINHPESIIRAPRLTEAELAICKAVGAKWVSRNTVGTESLHLWDAKPKGDRNFYNGDATSLATVAENLFPSVHPGDCIEVEGATE